MGQYYSIAADSQYINIAKVGPTRPAIAYADDTTDTNFIQDVFFQFRTRFIYDDFQIGIAGVISDISFPNPALTKNNRIDVTFNTGHHTVTKIQLLRRIGNGVSETGNDNTEWYVYQTLDKVAQGYSDNATVTFPFYGNEGINPVSRIDSDKIFETVPYTALQPEIVNTNQIVVGDITEGNNNVVMNATAAFLYNFAGSYQYGFGAIMRFSPYVAGGFPAVGDIMYYLFDNTTYYSYTLVLADITDALSMATRFSANLTSNGITNSVSPVGGGTYDVLTPGHFISHLRSVRQKTQRTFKSSARRDVAIVYYDAEYRCTGAQVIARSLYSKTATDLGISPLLGPFQYPSNTNIGTLPYLRVTINNLPPSFASFYQVLISSSDTADFLQFVSATASGSAYIVIPDTSMWSYSEGDRIRVLVGSDIFANDLAGKNYVIKSYDPSTGGIELYGINNSIISNAWRVEIYRVNLANRSLFYEFSGIRAITGGFHVGNIQTQTNSQPAIVEIYDGDVYEKDQIYIPGWASGDPIIITIPEPFRHQTRQIATNTDFSADTGTYNDIYSPYWGKGRVIVETPNQTRQRFTALRRWSNPLDQNTQINGLCTWDEGNYDNILNQRFGPITGLRQVGYTLKTLQQSNISSTLLNRIQTFNADGSSNILVTDRLLGSTNPSESEYGTKHPGSVCVIGDNLYFFDSLRGEVLRDSTNGTFPISSYFMRNYWRAKGLLVESNAAYEVVTGIDLKYMDVYFTIRKAGSPNTEETIYFNEPQNAWKYLVDMKAGDNVQIIEGYANVGQSFFSIMNGAVWQENALLNGSESVYLVRFGEQKSLVVETIGMIDADKVKIFLTHGVHANLSPDLVEFFIPANTMYPNGMYSYLKPGNYKYREGVFYANIKRDWFTKGIPGTDAAGRLQIAEGRAMRGHVCKVRLTFTTSEYINLFSTSIGMIPSEKS